MNKEITPIQPPVPYLEDSKGFFSEVNGDKIRPIDINNGIIVFDSSKLANKRAANRERVKILNGRTRR